jgi:hypothetical protein
MTTTPKGHSAIFLAVDMFTGYVQLKPLKSRKTDALIEAVKLTIILPFGIPKFFHCDNESAMANSTDFHKFMEPLGVQFLPCSTASPWSNGAAEQAVQTIKKPFALSLNRKMLKTDGMIICISLSQLTTNQLQFMDFRPNNYILAFQTPQLLI